MAKLGASRHRPVIGWMSLTTTIIKIVSSDDVCTQMTADDTLFIFSTKSNLYSAYSIAVTTSKTAAEFIQAALRRSLHLLKFQPLSPGLLPQTLSAEGMRLFLHLRQ